ncbi:MAG TPA: AmmeMemoRadiSam system protein B [Gemmatimonadales bacterium]|nr:AmmeMemoRadiSam system protein B [Gemmatimonadales bacterium]
MARGFFLGVGKSQIATTRAPVVSGRFYPGAKTELAATVAELLAAARADSGSSLPPFRAIIAPHAGYVYSGPTAAAVFARVTLPDLIIIVAPNHTGVCRAPGGASLWEDGAFRTPLGDVPVDAACAARVAAATSLVAVDHEAHRGEHAIEVLLPFLQVLRPGVRIVPLVLAWDTWDEARELGEALARVVREAAEPVLLLASSDLNHYEPASVSERKDARALEAVTALDGAELLARCRRERITMCGRAPVAVVLAAARALGATRADVVDYRHSGWASGDNSQVVGYGGVVIP